MQMMFTPANNDYMNTNSYYFDVTFPRGLWIPWEEDGTYKTDGWQTVSFPLDEFTKTHDGNTCEKAFTNSMLGGLTLFVWNGGVEGTECTPRILIDNIRIVEK